KVPALDTVNDILQSVIRPASGGLVFSAGATSDTIAVTDPEAFIHSSSFWPFIIGVGVALVPHVLKLVSRPVVNAVTFGAGASALSTIEDIASAAITVLAVVIPLVALGLLVVLIVAAVSQLRRLQAKRRARTAGTA